MSQLSKKDTEEQLPKTLEEARFYNAKKFWLKKMNEMLQPIKASHD